MSESRPTSPRGSVVSRGGLGALSPANSLVCRSVADVEAYSRRDLSDWDNDPEGRDDGRDRPTLLQSRERLTTRSRELALELPPAMPSHAAQAAALAADDDVVAALFNATVGANTPTRLDES